MVYGASLEASVLKDIAAELAQPEQYLKNNSLVVMGNSSLDKAQVVFLPEVHDDPKSLTTQLMLLAREKQKNRPFIVLDESLSSMKKSMWDIFSQKSLEIIAARDQRKNRQAYAPRGFENALQVLANKLKSRGELQPQNTGLWGMSEFSNNSTPFYGWDSQGNASLTERNVVMVQSLKTALKTNNRIFVMAGARHIPELEHLTSKRLLCQGDSFNDIGGYFKTIRAGYGKMPELSSGIGATLPIYDFLAPSINYAVVFSRDLYPELDKVVNQFKQSESRCFRL